ncbi:MAG: phasin family protein [Pseudomonadota bacterium]
MEKMYPFTNVDVTKLFGDFRNTDVTKLFGDFRFPEFDIEAVLVSQRKNLEAMTTLSQLAFDGAQTLAKRQAELVKECFDCCTKGATAVFEAEALEDKAVKQVDLAKDLFEETLADLNEMADLTAKSTNAIFHVFEKRVAESLGEVRNAVQKQAKGATKAAKAATVGKSSVKAA